MSEQNPGEIWETDSVIMIRNAKALQRVVKELEKKKSKRYDFFNNFLDDARDFAQLLVL